MIEGHARLSGEPEAARLTQAAGKRIREVSATGRLVNPAVVLVGGVLFSAALLAGIFETLHRLAVNARLRA